jgi:hypothetical protein
MKPRVVERIDYVRQVCRGKRVLHLGCADAPYSPINGSQQVRPLTTGAPRQAPARDWVIQDGGNLWSVAGPHSAQQSTIFSRNSVTARVALRVSITSRAWRTTKS